MTEPRYPKTVDDLTAVAAVAVAALVGIALGCWLGDALGLIF